MLRVHEPAAASFSGSAGAGTNKQTQLNIKLIITPAVWEWQHSQCHYIDVGLHIATDRHSSGWWPSLEATNTKRTAAANASSRFSTGPDEFTFSFYAVEHAAVCSSCL